jgi:PRELI-like family protein
MCSHNMTLSELLTVRETVQYTRHPSSPETKTQFTQRAEITALCGGWQKIKNKIEQATVDRFSQNAAKGREGFEMVLKHAREVFREERERVETTRAIMESPMESAMREGA